mmetsp:Transcript_46326/g.107820  ORF Transcript_46326/g.107820 Transcript_46326/m.107820 type:complete len:555 (+) Transcript_46326:82-1746(+)
MSTAIQARASHYVPTGLSMEATTREPRPYGASQSELAIIHVVRGEVDPEGKYDARTIWAGLKANGLEAQDIAPAFQHTMQPVSPTVPPENVKGIQDQRQRIWQDLRASRIEGLKATLPGLGPDDVRRYERCSFEIRPVEADDIDEEKLVASMPGLANFEEEMARKHEAVKAEQQRRANVLGTGFLREKKRMEDCDNKIENLEKRLKEYKKDQDTYWKTRREELKRKEERRTEGRKKAEKELEEWQEETMDSLDLKLARARKTRTEMSSTERLRDKIEGSNEKRREAFRQAVDLEEKMLTRLETKRQEVEARLEERRNNIEADLRQRAEARQDKFDKRQIKIAAEMQDFVETTLQKHSTFVDKFNQARDRRHDAVKGTSRNVVELTKKAQDRLKENTGKLAEKRREEHAALEGKHANAELRRQEVKKLGIKLGGDVHSYTEVKTRTWGELQKLKLKEMRGHESAKSQALVFEIAEWERKMAKQKEDQEELRRRRQEVAKEMMTFADKAREGFLKIQCEPDEKRVGEMMEELGFSMPKLQVEEPEEKEEQAKAAAF